MEQSIARAIEEGWSRLLVGRTRFYKPAVTSNDLRDRRNKRSEVNIYRQNKYKREARDGNPASLVHKAR